MIKRIFDIIASGIGLMLLSPILILIAIGISLGSKGGIFYRQERIGLGGIPFRIYKFRTMFIDADKKGLLTVGDRDPRVTPIGYYLRKSKLDELPQLINVFVGDMSLVGPRPEVKRYVDLYNESDKKILNVRPGITDYASIHYRNETEFLKQAADPEKEYIHTIMPAKIALNKKYIEEKSLFTDIKIIFSTFKSIIQK